MASRAWAAALENNGGADAVVAEVDAACVRDGQAAGCALPLRQAARSGVAPNLAAAPLPGLLAADLLLPHARRTPGAADAGGVREWASVRVVHGAAEALRGFPAGYAGVVAPLGGAGARFVAAPATAVEGVASLPAVIAATTNFSDAAAGASLLLPLSPTSTTIASGLVALATTNDSAYRLSSAPCTTTSPAACMPCATLTALLRSAPPAALCAAIQNTALVGVPLIVGDIPPGGAAYIPPGYLYAVSAEIGGSPPPAIVEAPLLDVASLPAVRRAALHRVAERDSLVSRLAPALAAISMDDVPTVLPERLVLDATAVYALVVLPAATSTGGTASTDAASPNGGADSSDGGAGAAAAALARRRGARRNLAASMRGDSDDGAAAIPVAAAAAAEATQDVMVPLTSALASEAAVSRMLERLVASAAASAAAETPRVWPSQRAHSALVVSWAPASAGPAAAPDAYYVVARRRLAPPGGASSNATASRARRVQAHPFARSIMADAVAWNTFARTHIPDAVAAFAAGATATTTTTTDRITIQLSGGGTTSSVTVRCYSEKCRLVQQNREHFSTHPCPYHRDCSQPRKSC